MNFSFYKIIFILFFYFVTGCQYAFVGLAEKIVEDREHEEQIFDFSMRSGIVSGLLSLDPNTLLEVNVNVWNRKVLLTGKTRDFFMYNKIQNYVLNYPKVEKLYNEITYTKKQNINDMVIGECKKNTDLRESNDRHSMLDDFFIDQTIRLKLIALGNSSIFNTQWRTIEGKVFLMGEAYNLIDKKRIVHVICGITDVVNVKSFIEIRPEKLP
ncbi:MAG: hypothetical protein CMH79_01890 [Nitrospinae bacterium]|nr:hypothetical protein [Nitrospinota bacterium]